MRRWFIVSVGLFMTACTTYHPPAHVSLQTQQRDQVECKALAELAAGPPGLLFREARRGHELATCLESRGWSKTPQEGL